VEVIPERVEKMEPWLIYPLTLMLDAANGPRASDGIEAVHDSEEGSSSKSPGPSTVEGPVPDARLAEGVARGDAEATAAQVVSGHDGLGSPEAVARERDLPTPQGLQGALDPASEGIVAPFYAFADPATSAASETHHAETLEIKLVAGQVLGASEAHQALAPHHAHPRLAPARDDLVHPVQARRLQVLIDGVAYLHIW